MTPAPAARMGVLRHRDFALLFAGQAASLLGDRVVMVALPFAVLSLPGTSAADVGLVMGANVLAFGIFVLAGGVVADRLSRQLTMLASDAVRAGVQAVGAWLLLSHHATVSSLVVIGLLYGAAEAFFRPAALGLVPQLVQPGEEQPANALLTLSNNVSMVAGPVLAGVLIAATSPGVVVALDAVTFVVSALSLAPLRPRPVPPAAHESIRAQLREGWDEVRSRSWVSATLGAFTAYHALVLPALFVLGPKFAADHRGGSAAWGIISSGFGLGAVAGSVLALRWRPARPGVVIGTALALASSQAAIVVASVPTAVVAALEAGTGIGVALCFTLWETALQQHIPAQAQSRVSAFDHFASVTFMPLGYVVMGPLAVWLGVRTVGVAASLVTATVCLAVVPLLRGLTAVQRPVVPAALVPPPPTLDAMLP